MEFRQDAIREALFSNAYHIKPQIFSKYELNADGTFKTFTLKFVYRGKQYILEEVYKDNTNMTDYCTLTDVAEPLKRFVDAERKVEELMKDGEGR